MHARRVYKALHAPLTIAGVDRRLFFLAVLAGAGVLNVFYSLLAGLLVAGFLYAFAFATRSDPKLLDILMRSARYRSRYDAAKHAPVRIDPC